MWLRVPLWRVNQREVPERKRRRINDLGKEQACIQTCKYLILWPDLTQAFHQSCWHFQPSFTTRLHRCRRILSFPHGQELHWLHSIGTSSAEKINWITNYRRSRKQVEELACIYWDDRNGWIQAYEQWNQPRINHITQRTKTKKQPAKE